MRGPGANPRSSGLAALGNFGDCAPVGEGVSEMRIHTGPGYRVYYTRSDGDLPAAAGWRQVYAARDIKRAIEMARKLEERA